MKLSEVLQNIKHTKNTKGDPDIPGICHDSRCFQPGDLFVAVKGLSFDGHQFVHEACAKGATAIVVQNETIVPVDYKGEVVVVVDSLEALAVIAHNFYEKPSEHLKVVGITGTNGKTSISLIIEELLNQGGLKTGVIGTVDNHVGDFKIPSTHTTPDSLAIQEVLAKLKSHGAQGISMEVSSHGLAMGRVDKVAFDVGVYTNLSRDHLDLHKTMEEYARAKGLLFKKVIPASPKKHKRIIINGDDDYQDHMKSDVPMWTYGQGEKHDFSASHIQLSLEQSSYEMKTPQGSIDVTIPHIGLYNVYNSMAAAAVALHFGATLSEIRDRLEKLSPIPGRMHRVETKVKKHVFVDYSHTPDSLSKTCAFLKEMRDTTSPESAIFTVFGCGGDRDKGKRPLMLEEARKFSDTVVVTSDNPRTEDPTSIIKDILQGEINETPSGILVEPDRKAAIELAIRKSKVGDIVLIAGKGHEDYQIIGVKKHPFDDYQVAKEILKR